MDEPLLLEPLPIEPLPLVEPAPLVLLGDEELDELGELDDVLPEAPELDLLK